MCKWFSKSIAVFLAVLFPLLLTGCFSTIPHEKSEADNLPQPDPEDGIVYKTDYMLYYGFYDTEYLTSVMRRVNVVSNELVELSVLRELISGGNAGNRAVNPLPEDLECLDMIEKNGVLYVTLNDALLDDEDSLVSTPDMFNRAVYSIVNTLSVVNGYEVQLLIDTDRNGVGEYITGSMLYDEFNSNNAYAAPLSFSSSVMVNSVRLFNYAMDKITNGDITAAANVFRSNDENVDCAEVLDECLGRQNGYIILRSVAVSETIEHGDKVELVVDFDFYTRGNTYKQTGSIELIYTSSGEYIVLENFLSALEVEE